MNPTPQTKQPKKRKRRKPQSPAPKPTLNPDLLRNIFEYSAAMIVTADEEGRITSFNPAAEQMMGYRRSELIGNPAKILYLRRSDRRKLLQKVKEKGKVVEFDTKMITKDRAVIDVSITMSQLRDEQGKVVGTVSISRDVTQERRLERRLERLSITDNLTGLFNRYHFFSRARQEIHNCRQREDPLTIILIDVDRFKEHNDQHGHLAGDRVLQEIGKILQRGVRREIDLPCRYGGDEFVILMPGADAAMAMITGERIRRRFKRAKTGNCSLSLGIAQMEEKDNVESFLHKADQAMYESKARGGNALTIY